jgi:hypothetical protein
LLTVGGNCLTDRSSLRCGVCGRQQIEIPMTGDQSRTLGIGERVCWQASATDLGTVIGTTWSEVIIDWDDGHTTSIQHNDMAHVERGRRKEARTFKRPLHQAPQAPCKPHAFSDVLAIDRRYSDFHRSRQQGGARKRGRNPAGFRSIGGPPWQESHISSRCRSKEKRQSD